MGLYITIHSAMIQLPFLQQCSSFWAVRSDIASTEFQSSLCTTTPTRVARMYAQGKDIIYPTAERSDGVILPVPNEDASQVCHCRMPPSILFFHRHPQIRRRATSQPTILWSHARPCRKCRKSVSVAANGARLLSTISIGTICHSGPTEESL